MDKYPTKMFEKMKGKRCGVSDLGSVVERAIEAGRVRVKGDVEVAVIKPNKFKARKTERHGRVFDSLKEANRYDELLLLEKAGQIQELECQRVFELDVNGYRVCRYVADFTYQQRGQMTVEDVKGHRTAVYKLKKRLLKAVLGIEILET